MVAVGKIDDLLHEPLRLLRRNDDAIGDEIVAIAGGGGSRRAEIIDLNGRGARQKDGGAEPLAGEVEIDEDVELFLLDEFDQTIVVDLGDVDERFDRVRDALLHRRVVARFGVQYRDFEPRFVVAFDHAGEQMAGRMVAQLAGKIGDPDAPVSRSRLIARAAAPGGGRRLGARLGGGELFGG